MLAGPLSTAEHRGTRGVPPRCLAAPRQQGGDAQFMAGFLRVHILPLVHRTEGEVRRRTWRGKTDQSPGLSRF